MSTSKYNALRDSWTEEDDETLLSPPIGKHYEQMILVPETTERDYAIEVEITLLHGEVLNNVLYKEAGVIVRYSGEGRYYYAGLGGFGARTFIGMVEDQNGRSIWSRLASQGKTDQIDFMTSYQLRVECQGSKIALFEDNTQLLSVDDDTFPTGKWGPAYRPHPSPVRQHKGSRSLNP